MATVRTEPTNAPGMVYTGALPSVVRRISWGAVLAGVAISLVVMFTLNMLGLSIGAATVNPISEAEPVAGLGTGAMIWFAASILLSLFAGGFVAGHMSGFYYDNDGVLHGLVTWAVVTLIGLFALTTSVGSVLSGAMSVASTAITAAGSAVGNAAGAVAPEVAAALDLQGMTLQGIQNDARSMMQANAANQAGTTGTSDNTTGSTDANATSTNNAVANTSMSLNEVNFNRALGKLLNGTEVTDADRDAVVTMLAENTGVTEDEARATVEGWEQTYMEVRQEAEETARRVAQAAADAVTAFAGAMFAAMVVGAFAAGLGGMTGTPQPNFTDPNEVRTTKA